MRRASGVALGRRRNAKTIRSGPIERKLTKVISGEVPPGVTVLRHERIHIDECGNPLGDRIGDPADHHSGVAVTAKYDVGQFLEPDDVRDILDVGFQIGASAGEMDTLARLREAKKRARGG